VTAWHNLHMTAVDAQVSVQEYLNTVYKPDCDYVDGELVDRNVGEKSHAKAQWKIMLLLAQGRVQWNNFPIQEPRVQISRTRFRVPDICVFAGAEPDEEIFTTPPFLCVEILSPEDRMSRMQERIDDYLGFGVEYVWVVDPRSQRAWIYRLEAMHEVRDGVLRTANPDIEVPLASVFPK
jgi:Uma2 family endonuclease